MERFLNLVVPIYMHTYNRLLLLSFALLVMILPLKRKRVHNRRCVSAGMYAHQTQTRDVGRRVEIFPRCGPCLRWHSLRLIVGFKIQQYSVKSPPLLAHSTREMR